MLSVSDLVRLSTFPDGPSRAVDLLREHGILLCIEPHLPGTALDGAALLLDDGIPVIGLTLRHDRIDNFWFTLLHELGHIYLHFNRGLDAGFVDDDLQDAHVSDLEHEADDFARNQLIPDDIPTNLISIADGQIVLSSKLFYEGQKPAVDIGLSVSRVGGKTQAPVLKALAETLRLEYAQFLELELFTRFSTTLDRKIRRE